MKSPFPHSRKTFVFFAFSFAFAGMARAQTIGVFQEHGGSLPTPLGPTQIAVASSGGAMVAVTENAEVVKGHPYRAQADTEIKQTLMDGSHIEQRSTAEVARDSQGRTVRMQKMDTFGPWRSDLSTSGSDGPMLVSIFDPVAKEHIDYISDRKVAHVVALPALPEGAVVAAAGIEPETSTADPGPTVRLMFSTKAHSDSQQTSRDPNLGSSGPNSRTESLGSKKIEGIEVEGTRTTTIIPQGTIGNDRDILITRETWYSPELQLVLDSSQDDPRFGQTTYSLTSIEQKEPEKDLFRIPAGFRIDKLPAPPLPSGVQSSSSRNRSQ